MPKLPDDWSTFKRAVEGLVTSSSCVIQDGLPVFNCDPDVQKPPKSNLLVLAQVLRGNQPIPQDIRNWLADMMDPEAESSFKFQLKKNGRGPKGSGVSLHWEAAKYVVECDEKKLPRKQTLGNAEKKYNLSRSTILKAIAEYKPVAEAEHQLGVDEGWWPATPKK